VSGLSEIFDEIGQVGPLGRVHVNVVAVANVLLVALKQARNTLKLDQKIKKIASNSCEINIKNTISSDRTKITFHTEFLQQTESTENKQQK
jgi:hypothetical protein